MHKFIISIPNAAYAALLALYESGNPRPETVMVEGREQSNPYTYQEMLDRLIIALIYERFRAILGRNGIAVTKETE